MTDCDIINVSHISSENEKEVIFKNGNENEKLVIQSVELQSLNKKSHIAIINDEEDKNTSRCLVLEMLVNIKDIDEYVILVDNEEENFYKNYVNNECINKIKYNSISSLLEKANKEREEHGISKNMLIVLDYCVNTEQINKDVLELFLNARNYNITLISLFTNPHVLRPEIRINFDYVFSLTSRETKYNKKNCEKYFEIFPTFETFQTVFEQITDNTTFLVIKNDNNNNNDNYDKIKWFKMSYMYNVNVLKKLNNVNKLIFLEEELSPIIQVTALNKSTKEIESLDIKKYDLEEYKLQMETKNDNKKILIIGKSGTGKSWLVLNLIDEMKDNFDEMLIFSEKEKFDKFYFNKLNSSCIVYNFDENILKQIIEKQEIENFKKRILVVFDDILLNKNLKSGFLSHFIGNSRYNNITFILTMPYPIGLSPEIRTNFEDVYLFDQDIMSNIKRLHEHYNNFTKNFNMFNQIINECCKHHKFLLIKKNYKNQNNVYYGRAKEITSFINIKEITNIIKNKDNFEDKEIISKSNCFEMSLNLIDSPKSSESSDNFSDTLSTTSSTISEISEISCKPSLYTTFNFNDSLNNLENIDDIIITLSECNIKLMNSINKNKNNKNNKKIKICKNISKCSKLIAEYLEG